MEPFRRSAGRGRRSLRRRGSCCVAIFWNSPGSTEPKVRPDPARRPICSNRASGSSTRTFVRRRRTRNVGQPDLGGHPVRRTNPALHSGRGRAGDHRHPRLDHAERLAPLPLEGMDHSVDHKRIGVMYCLLAGVMLLRGFSDAIMMRSQQALAFRSEGYLPPDHYDQIFSAHGTIMIFFVAMPFVIGLMNFVMPLQLGIRDVAFPTLNSVSFWLTAVGALLVNISLVVGEFARTGWLPFPPLSEIAYSPGVGVDYYLWSLQISGVGTLLTGVNFVTTVLKIHAPGMTYMRMPMFCWTALASNLLIVAAFPVLTATLAMLLLDRYLGFHFFTNEAGGNVMMFMNL